MRRTHAIDIDQRVSLRAGSEDMTRVPTPSTSRRRSRPRRLIAGLVVTALALAAFVVALLPRLPVDPLLAPVVERLATDAGVRLRYQRSRLAWDGITLADLEVDVADAAAGDRSVRIDRLGLRPSLTGFLWRRSGAPWRVRASLYGGSATARLDRDGGRWRAEITWSAVDLGKLGLDVARDLSGVSEGRLDAAAPGAPGAEGDGSWKLAVLDAVAKNLRAGQLVLPPIAIQRLDSTGTWQGRRLTIESMDAAGSFGSVSLAGRVVLRDPTEQSALNLTLTHRTPAVVPPDLAIVMRLLLPRSSAAAAEPTTYHVGGTLGLPTVGPGT
jgi:type II secretion system protein N